MSEKIYDFQAWAEEHGGRAGVIPGPTEDTYEMVVVRSRGNENLVSLCVTDYTGEYIVTVGFHREDLEWLLENQLEDDDD